VPENRRKIIQLVDWLGQVKPVLDIGAKGWRGSFGAQGEFVGATFDVRLGLEIVHLLGDNIGSLAYGAVEQVGLLKGGGAYFLVAVQPRDVAHDAFEPVPLGDVVRPIFRAGQDVVSAFRGNVFQHGNADCIMRTRLNRRADTGFAVPCCGDIR